MFITYNVGKNDCYIYLVPGLVLRGDLRQGGHQAEQLVEVVGLQQQQHGDLVPAGEGRQVSAELPEAWDCEENRKCGNIFEMSW